eukprot:7364731-Pyramimonas_sp.AAC.1
MALNLARAGLRRGATKAGRTRRCRSVWTWRRSPLSASPLSTSAAKMRAASSPKISLCCGC